MLKIHKIKLNGNIFNLSTPFKSQQLLGFEVKITVPGSIKCLKVIIKHIYGSVHKSVVEKSLLYSVGVCGGVALFYLTFYYCYYFIL